MSRSEGEGASDEASQLFEEEAAKLAAEWLTERGMDVSNPGWIFWYPKLGFLVPACMAAVF